MKKFLYTALLLCVLHTCIAQDLSGIWQYADTIYADGVTFYDFYEIKDGYSFTFTPSQYDELRSFKKMEGRCILKKDSLVFYVKEIMLINFSGWILQRRDKNDSIPYYMQELYYDTATHAMEKRKWPSTTNYWKWKEGGKVEYVTYNPPLKFVIPFRLYKEGTFDVLEIDGDKFYYIDPAPDDYGTQIDNREDY